VAYDKHGTVLARAVADGTTGVLHGTGQDELGDCTVDGIFKPGKDRVAWTQTYQLRRNCTIVVEVWGYICVQGGWRLSARGQFQSSEALGRRGFFVMRPALIENIRTMLMRDIVPRAEYVLPPVDLVPLEDAACGKDVTCTICLEDCEQVCVQVCLFFPLYLRACVCFFPRNLFSSIICFSECTPMPYRHTRCILP
jgi:hypothetical protein